MSERPRPPRLPAGAAPGETGEGRRPTHGLVEHRLGEPTGEGVLLAGVIGVHEDEATGQRPLGAVGESGAGAHTDEVTHGVVGEASEGEDHPHVGQQFEFARQPRGAATAFIGGGAVPGWGAVHRRGDPGTQQLGAVIGGDRTRRGGEPSPPQGGEEPVPGAVTGEHPPGAVRTVGGGGEPHHPQAGVRRPEPRDRPPPVVPVDERRPGVGGDLGAPRHEPRAGVTPRHRCIEVVEAPGGSRCQRWIGEPGTPPPGWCPGRPCGLPAGSRAGGGVRRHRC